MGLTSFGGSVVHLGYCRSEIVEKRKWLTEGHYVDIIALCQFLPGPAFSQVGIAIGMSCSGGGALFGIMFLRGDVPSAAVVRLGSFQHLRRILDRLRNLARPLS